MTADENEVIEKVKGAIRIYHAIANSLRILLIIIGTIGISAALFVTAFTGAEFLDGDDLMRIRVASFLSALSLTLLTAFNITAKGNNARNAFRFLDHAYCMYQIGKYSLEDLVNAKDNAEKILGSVDFQTTTIGGKPQDPGAN